MIGFVLRALITAIGLWIATRWVSGIRIDDTTTLVHGVVADRLPREDRRLRAAPVGLRDESEALVVRRVIGWLI